MIQQKRVRLSLTHTHCPLEGCIEQGGSDVLPLIGRLCLPQAECSDWSNIQSAVHQLEDRGRCLGQQLSEWTPAVKSEVRGQWVKCCDLVCRGGATAAAWGGAYSQRGVAGPPGGAASQGGG